ncbi:ABC transporter permease [Chachezhania antarctica]|uniref:ABC transporter permease n=1 Tax=Chachezhania antarctica TaxID=2340860 RepID=UPI000EAC1010|nr:ABC transporter permease [Chachezhania antarctica]|tara:strand:+ start:1921 stop:2745 length:825 start_codon:yes stop_codon:yes gene_type:complete
MMRTRFNLGLGIALTAILGAMALIALVWTPYDVNVMNIAGKLQPPSMQHLLGTDQLGRDILSMIMVGAGTSIAVAALSVVIGLVFGVPLGLVAASNKDGWLDELIMRWNDVVFAFPFLALAILITAVLGASAANAVLAFGIFNIPVFARVTRGGALSLWEREFILSAQVSGKSRAWISAEHILPNVANILIVQGTIQFALGIQVEAALSFIGLGVQPPTPSLGRMLADAQTLVTLAPHMAIFPGLAIILIVLGLNLLGDGLRDLLDPRLKGDRS